MLGNSSTIVSSEHEPHPRLISVLDKHKHYLYRQPYRSFSKPLFEYVSQFIKQEDRPIILDSGCGTGQSSITLANCYSDHWVIGIDKSKYRLRHYDFKNNVFRKDNVLLIYADIVDFWRLCLENGWKLSHHFLLYPNPWPKKKHLLRRWYAHPIFPTLLRLGGKLECRSNWNHYIQEFRRALEYSGFTENQVTHIKQGPALTPFEKKYHASGHQLAQLKSNLNKKVAL